MSLEDSIAQYMDEWGLKLLEVERDLAESMRKRSTAMSMRAFGLASVDVAVLDLRLIAYERWLWSNPYPTRHLPHVLRQRDRINDRPIEGSDRMLASAQSARPPAMGSNLPYQKAGPVTVDLTTAAARERAYGR